MQGKFHDTGLRLTQLIKILKLKAQLDMADEINKNTMEFTHEESIEDIL